LHELFANLDIDGWLQRLSAFLGSRHTVELLALQLVVIAVAVLVAWGLRAATRPWTSHLVGLVRRRFPNLRLAQVLDRQMPLIYLWLLLAVAARAGGGLGPAWRLPQIAADLTALWLVLRFSTAILRDALIARLITTIAWVLFALDLLGLLQPTEGVLDNLAITIGSLRLSVLLIGKAAIVVAVLLWGATLVSRLVSSRIQHIEGLSRSVQLLIGNLIKIALISIAVLIGLNTVGIDLTAFTVFSGAIGVGVGFGLQKIVSNFVSGIILLVERSIKPGDVIEIGNTFGQVVSLGARYASVRGRNGKEYLIPNENLITNEVVNWSYSNLLVRIDAEFGVSYASDPRRVRALAIDAAKGTARVLPAPAPLCHITGFGDSSVNFVLRFWIEDPFEGVANIKGDVYLSLWEVLQEAGVEIPFPQRDLHLRTVAPEVAGAFGAASSKADIAQPERVADDKDRTGAHRGAGEHRA